MASKMVIMTIVFIFDVIAFGLAVAAEQRRSTATTKQDSEKDYNYCVYDSDISTGYGVGAFLFLMASQVLIMVASRCFCCGKALSPGGSRACALVLFIFCWVTFLIAEVCLLAGSVRNAYHTKYTTIFSEDPPSCQTVRKGVFAAGAAFTFFTCIVSQFYYVSYSKSRGSFAPYGGEASVGLGPYKYRGVRQRHRRKWVAEIRLPQKRSRLWLGTFDSAEAELALASDREAFRLRGENARLNFPHLFLGKVTADREASKQAAATSSLSSTIHGSPQPPPEPTA